MGIETLAIGSLVASAAGAGVSAMGASQQASATAAADTYKSQVAANNAIIAQRNADSAIASGGVQAETNDLKNKNMQGQQLATEASNGLDVGSGTNVALRDSAANLGHLDTLTIINNAMKQSAGFKAQGMNFTAESQLDTAAASNAKTAGQYAVATSLLGGASSFADKWAGYSRSGAFA